MASKTRWVDGGFSDQMGEGVFSNQVREGCVP